jgi:hypothetical protein
VKDLNDQLIEKLKEKEFDSQLDEATVNNNNDAHLICCVWFIDGNNIVENRLFCKSITASAKAQDLFDILDTFISENGLECASVCTGGASFMSGCYSYSYSFIYIHELYKYKVQLDIVKKCKVKKYTRSTNNFLHTF